MRYLYRRAHLLVWIGWISHKSRIQGPLAVKPGPQTYSRVATPPSVSTAPNRRDYGVSSRGSVCHDFPVYRYAYNSKVEIVPSKP